MRLLGAPCPAPTAPADPPPPAWCHNTSLWAPGLQAPRILDPAMPVDTPCLSGGIFQSLPLPTPEPPAPLGLFSPVSLHPQSHTRDQPPSFPLREALARPGPLSCGVAGRGTSICSLGSRPSQARTRSSRRAQRLPCPLLLCPRLPGQAPGRHVGDVPCGSHGQAGGAVSPAAPRAPAVGQGAA